MKNYQISVDQSNNVVLGQDGSSFQMVSEKTLIWLRHILFSDRT